MPPAIRSDSAEGAQERCDADGHYKLPNVPQEVAQAVEESLSQAESVNAPIFRRIADGDLKLSSQERADLLFFLALLASRVPAFRDRIEKIYEDLGQQMLTMSAHHRPYFVDTMRKAMAQAGQPIPSDDEIEEHRQWALDPTNYTIKADPIVSLAHGFRLALELIYPIFVRMQWAFYTAPEGLQFITSDCPVSWFDPSPRPPVYRGHGLGMKHVEVTVPIGPRVAMLGTHAGAAGVYEASAAQVMLLNIRRLYWTSEHVYAAKRSSATMALVMAAALASRGPGDVAPS